MADKHQNHAPESLETVKMSREEMDREEMDKNNQPAGAVHDGRFGDKWDSEINIPTVLWVAVGLAAIAVLFFVWGWVLYGGFVEDVEKSVAPQPVAQSTERSLPPGPLLQASPEEELIEMRRELNARLNGYGWIDEAAGKVHIPIDQAMALVLERHLAVGASTPAEAAAEGADAGEAPAEEAGTP